MVAPSCGRLVREGSGEGPAGSNQLQRTHVARHRVSQVPKEQVIKAHFISNLWAVRGCCAHAGVRGGLRTGLAEFHRVSNVQIKRALVLFRCSQVSQFAISVGEPQGTFDDAYDRWRGTFWQDGQSCKHEFPTIWGDSETN